MSQVIDPLVLAGALEELHRELREAVSALEVCIEKCDRGDHVERAAAEHRLDRVLTVLETFRDAVSQGVARTPVAYRQCATGDELAEFVSTLTESLRAVGSEKGRDALQLLASELDRGVIRASTQARRRTLESIRLAALGEATAALTDAKPSVSGFPGPQDGDSWLTWYWNLQQGEQAAAVDLILESAWLQIFRFVGAVQATDWDSSPSCTSDEKATTGHPAPPDSQPVDRTQREDPPISGLLKQGEKHEPAPAQVSVNVKDAAAPRDTHDVPQRPVLVIEDFNGFKARHWINKNGDLEIAPWQDPAFVTTLGEALLSSLCADQWASAIIFNRALDLLGSPSSLDAQCLALAIQLRAGRWPPADDQSIEFANSLREAIDRDGLSNCFHDRAQVFLGIAQPLVLQLLDRAQVVRAVNSVHFSGEMTSVLIAWAECAIRTDKPFSLLQRLYAGAETHTLAELTASESALRNAVYESLKKNHSAAGGRIQHTHCRRAWNDFISIARDLVVRAAQQPHDPEVRREMRRLEKKAEKIFDRFGARHHDRATMDRAVESLVAGVEKLFNAADLFQSASNNDACAREVFPNAVIDFFRPNTSVMAHLAHDESWLQSLFAARISGAVTVPDRVFHSTLVRRRPWLVALWPNHTSIEKGLDADQCADPLSAAAHLLHGDELPADTDPRQWAANACPSLLRYFGEISPREKAIADESDKRHRDAFNNAFSQLRQLAVDLAELADGHASEAAAVMANLEEECTNRPERLQLLSAWATEVVGLLRAYVADASQRLMTDALSAGLPREIVDALANGRRFADLLSRLGRPISDDVPRMRASAFRTDAATLWKDPRLALSAVDQEIAGSEPTPNGDRLRQLVRAWNHAAKRASTPLGAEKQRELRELFVHIVFDVEAQRRKSKLVDHAHAIRISAESVTEWINAASSQPTFLPQLRRIRDIVVKAPPVAPGDRALSHKLLSSGETGSLTVILVPGLPADVREELRRRVADDVSKPIAFIDDLDMCRLFNPSGAQPSMVEAFVEIALEQQRWDAFSPYEIQEGQHVRMEMYVGRRTEAEQLATGTTYSRIYSGRRLGKTALLRYIEHVYDGYQLPSGNALRVKYIPIVGLDSEDTVVTDILEGLGADALSGSPRERLKEAVTRLLAANAKESYLVFLDEADTFVESQILRDGEETGEESTLAWTMRSLEANKDSRDQPRIRFVVCGYRETNRSEGAWGNWGDILLLNPLDRTDAVSLVAGPLARLGLDARDQADGIAFRCGYQPAVIIHFCNRLLVELQRRIAFSSREGHRVSQDDVVAVYHLPEVQEKVREICWLNFVGDPQGKLTFAAFLAIASRLPAGAPIEDAIRLIGDEIAGQANETAECSLGADTIARHLRHLVTRSLLWEADHTPLALRLRFPHQLPVLLQDSPEGHMRDALSRLKAPQRYRRTAWLIPEDTLDHIRYCLGPDGREYGLHTVVLGSHWPDPLVARNGLSRRIPADALIVECAELDETRLALQDNRPRVCVGGAGLLRQVLQRTRLENTGFEVVRLGRLTSDGIDGYFKRCRGIEFTKVGALDEIMRLTSGIPILVRKLNNCLEDGATVDGAALDAALKKVEDGMPNVLRELQSPDVHKRLLPRELELLRQIAVISRVDARDILNIMLDLNLRAAALEMGGVPRDHELQSSKAYGGEDDIHVDVLLGLGLLPSQSSTTNGSGTLGDIGELEVDDALYAILAERHPAGSLS